MDVIQAVQQIRDKFKETGSPAEVPLLSGSTFEARLVAEGVKVSNLGVQPFLPWAAFQEAICVLIRNGGRADRGDAMNFKLGDPGLSLDSIEGHVAHVVYGKQKRDSVFRRITPIACILIWAGICKHERGKLVLLWPGWLLHGSNLIVRANPTEPTETAWHRRPRRSIKCEIRGALLEAGSEGELAKLLHEHAKEAHDIDMSDQEAARQVTEGMLSDI